MLKDVSELPTLLTEYPYLPAKYAGGFFRQVPTLVVLHSGDTSTGVAEYFQAPADNRIVSAHFAWSSTQNGFAQCVPLNTVAWHAGGSVFQGQKKLNARSVGIELPGPAALKVRPALQRDALRALLSTLQAQIPNLTTITKHSSIQEGKKDPGPGVTDDWFTGLGYKLVFTPQFRAA